MKTSIPTGYVVDPGKTNLLLSAPHCIDHRRPNFTGKVEAAEESTKEISEEICALTGAALIYAKECDLSFDPNYTLFANNPYKQEIKSLVKKRKITYLLDIHGLSDRHNYDMAIFYPEHFIKSRKLAFNLAKAISKGKLRDALIQISPLSTLDRETISQFAASKLSIPANQIEVARYIRKDDALRQELIRNLSSFLLGL